MVESFSTTEVGDSFPPLIGAMLAPPRVSPTLISRPRLLARLDEAALGPVTILSGEPAAGKTSLATDWLHSLEPARPTAWLTVRPFLDDAITFWRYLLAALTPLRVEVGDLDLALTDGDAPGEHWITALANRLADVHDDPVVVVDDFHELESTVVLDAVHRLLDRLPTNTHVVLLTRVQPPWKLSGWRMSGRVAEINSVDLRFTVDEGRKLVASAGVELDDDAVLQLLDRTEGWAGGLRLALLSMRHSSDPKAFVERFAADDELVASYLLREVLERQPVEVSEFLLEVSVLDELTAPTCDLLRAREDSAELIERCRAENLFVTDLGGAGEAFHLHSLVAQLLLATLAHQDPERLRRLHERASAIAEEAGNVGTAIAHATAAGDDKRLGELMTTHANQLAQQGRFEEIRSWLAVLLRDPSSHDLQVELGLAVTLGICGRTTEALALVDAIEAVATSDRMRYAARQARGMTMMVGGRLEELATVAHELDVEVPDGHEILPFEAEGAVTHWTGVAALITADLCDARSALDAAVSLIDRPDVRHDVNHVDAWAFRSLVAHTYGDLGEAERYADRCLRHNAEMGGGETSAVTGAYVALGNVAWERDDLDRADELLAVARRTIRPIMWEAVLVQLAESRVLASRGEIDAAREQLVECGQTYLNADHSPALRGLLSERAVELALRAGDLYDAARWERTFAMDSTRSLAPAMEIRLAVARGAIDLDEVVDRALSQKQPLPGEIDTLLAAAAAIAARDERRAVEFVARAACLAEPQRMVRRFRDAEPAVASALLTLGEGPLDPGEGPVVSQFFVHQLANSQATADSGVEPRTPSHGLVDPLTSRELQVLGLLIDGQSYSEIGAALFVSRNTVKSHASHIYAKLGVSSRQAAADAARVLDLV